VVHAGAGAEETGNESQIWSHKWVFTGGPLDADNTKIFGYLTIPENCKIGVCAHELGHLLFGWPDLYDTDGSSEGLGNWCLMGGGSWNGNGDIPAHPSAWCKVNQGWVAVSNRKTNSKATIKDVKTSHRVQRLWMNGTSGKEYFLIENRQRTLYDRTLPGDGLLVYHVDETIDSNDDERHPFIKLLEADGRNQLRDGANRGDAGDPFPGSAKNVTLTATSTPDTKSYGKLDTCVTIRNISASAATMTASFAVKCAAGSGAPKPSRRRPSRPARKKARGGKPKKR